MLILIAILVFVQIALIWAIFNIRTHIEKQTTILTTSIRLLAKIANNTGSDKDEIVKILSDLDRKL
jgi:hypothetical protein